MKTIYGFRYGFDHIFNMDGTIADVKKEFDDAVDHNTYSPHCFFDNDTNILYVCVRASVTKAENKKDCLDCFSIPKYKKVIYFELWETEDDD